MTFILPTLQTFVTVSAVTDGGINAATSMTAPAVNNLLNMCDPPVLRMRQRAATQSTKGIALAGPGRAPF
ncbi:MAG TPA: hypothetical protein VGA77_01700 [Propylenella sp.]